MHVRPPAAASRARSAEDRPPRGTLAHGAGEHGAAGAVVLGARSHQARGGRPPQHLQSVGHGEPGGGVVEHAPRLRACPVLLGQVGRQPVEKIGVVSGVVRLRRTVAAGNKSTRPNRRAMPPPAPGPGRPPPARFCAGAAGLRLPAQTNSDAAARSRPRRRGVRAARRKNRPRPRRRNAGSAAIARAGRPASRPDRLPPRGNRSSSSSTSPSRAPCVIAFGTFTANRKPAGTECAQRVYVAVRCGR